MLVRYLSPIPVTWLGLATSARGARPRLGEIAAVLDLSWVHTELAPHYSHLGRPSIDRVLMIRILILGYVSPVGSRQGA